MSKIYGHKIWAKSGQTDRAATLTFANKYPVSSETRLIKQLKLNRLLSDSYGQLIYYASTAKYELFLYESFDTFDWKIYFLYENDVKEVTIKNDEDRNIYTYQITEDAVYVYSNKIYKVDVKDYKVEILELPYNEFAVDSATSNFGGVFIHNDNYFKATSEYKIKRSINKQIIQNENRGVFLRYDFKTKKADTIFEADYIEKVFPIDNGYLVLSSEKDTFKPCLKYYDNSLKLLKSQYIEIKSEHGKITTCGFGSFFSLHDGKLFGVMGVDGKRINELVVIDTQTAKVLYQSEFINKKASKEKLGVLSATFHLRENGKLVDLSSY
uniref:hypothetical protein n=1 Tax=Acetivibrio cellulolyticus TaxID=35830 RepID=UPI0001E2CC73|nr:hypothetical protein [Acetivibrio cellulolyticus]